MIYHAVECEREKYILNEVKAEVLDKYQFSKTEEFNSQ